MSSFVDKCFKLSETHDLIVFTIHTTLWCSMYYFINKNHNNDGSKKSITTTTTTATIKNNNSNNKLHQQQSSSNGTYKLKFFEKILLFIMVSVTLINIMLRIVKGVPQWLLQPCHVLSAVLIYVIANKNTDSNVFYSYFYSAWMPLVGLLAVPDDSWFYYWWEPIVFYVHHWTMILIPFYYLLFNHRYHSHLTKNNSLNSNINTKLYNNTKYSWNNRLRLFGTVFTFGMLYHSIVLGIGGIIINEDLNSMKCRFTGGEIFGIYWREALTLGGLILGLLFNYLPDTIIHYFFNWKNNINNNNNNNINSNNNNEKKSSILSNVLSDGLYYIQTIINSEIKKNK